MAQTTTTLTATSVASMAAAKRYMPADLRTTWERAINMAIPCRAQYSPNAVLSR